MRRGLAGLAQAIHAGDELLEGFGGLRLRRWLLGWRSAAQDRQRKRQMCSLASAFSARYDADAWCTHTVVHGMP